MHLSFSFPSCPDFFSRLPLTYQTGQDAVVRAQFINNGVLSNTEDSNFRAVSDDWLVFTFAHDLGTVSVTATDPVIYTVGHARDPPIQFIIANNVYQPRSVYFWGAYSSVANLISDSIGDYSDALRPLSIRQAFGALELTLSKNSDGSWNTDDVLEGDGNVNTVYVIMPTWPILLYTNPTLAKFTQPPVATN
ncbi:uncharacterized protein EDB91DRAFT_1243439 [Suillus paluster]|uniref:uncharacterized protein n=1 Tax=Suillus paluster TaxID=48578 RepID=UPI001B882664|nr:uncharacterized protein EDB91DRAFT_1243439 [Suillus paluster]KAG1752673.1 hypothetical protein EDB91DRAFT_1243439 [Suillus paluster]